MPNDRAERPLTIFTAGATREGLAACLDRFRDVTGIVADAPTDHGHVIRQRVIDGTADADAIVIPTDMIDDLAEKGLVVADGQVAIGSIPIGAAVREGAPLPDVSTVEALESALRAAVSIVITTAPSGRHMDAVIGRLGLQPAVEDRIVRLDTGLAVNEHLARSEIAGEIAFGVATEILFHRNRGVAYAGALPEEVQMRNAYRAVCLASSRRAEEVRRLLGFLTGAEARAAFAETGVEPGDAP